MQEIWKDIYGFPGYAVSNLGRVMNTDQERLKIASPNQAGIMSVLLMKDTQQFRRSVARLVAERFLQPPRQSHFNALIHLDGNKENNAADNLAWRPRWFAVKYHQQFLPGGKRGFRKPVVDLKTGETFPTSWEAAVKYGLLDHEIMTSVFNRTYVFPTGQQFRVLDD